MARRQQNDQLIIHDHEPAQPVAKNERELITWCNIVVSCLSITGIVLLSILISRSPPAPLPAPCPITTGAVALVADNVTCGMTNDCQQGFRNADNASCLVLPRPTNQTCKWACALSEEPLGTCNALGECVGNQSVCPGTCLEDSDCPYSFFSDASDVYDPDTEWTFSSWYNPKECRYGTCVYAVLDIYVVSSEFPNFKEDDGKELVKGWWPGASRFQCLDYVNPDLVTDRPGCIRYERFLLSSDMVFYSSYTGIGGAFANGTFPFQVSLCVMSWACSKPHTFASGVGGSSIDDVPVKTLAQRGFTPIASSRKAGGVSSDDALLGIANPRLRNSMMAAIEEKTKAALPAFLESIAARALPPSPS